MRIERLIIQEFGRLQETELVLNAGFQMIFGANEQGKSTMMAFIRAMFYGFSGGGRKLETNERRLYTPWNGQRMGGAIIFEHQGTHYRLERQFGKTRANDKMTLMHDTTGQAIEIGSQNEPGQFLFSLSENEFSNTVFVSQLGSQLGPSDELLARLSNLAGSGDASISHAQIDQRIRQALTDLIAARGRGGKIYELSENIEHLHQRREAAVAAAGQQMERLQTLQREQKSLERLTFTASLLQTKADWQEKLVQANQWLRIEERRRQLDQTRQEQIEKEQSLDFDSLTVADAWLIQARELEQAWQEKHRQLIDRQQALTNVKEHLDHLVLEGERFKTVADISRTHINTLRSRLTDQKNTAAALKSQVREHESVIAECEKHQEQLVQMQRDRAADQRDFEKSSEKSKQDLAEAERIAQANEADITQADQDYARIENELHQHRQSSAAQTQQIRSALSCSHRCRYIFTAGLVLAIISGLSAQMFRQPLLWLAVLPLLLLPLLFWLAERKNLAAEHSSSIKQQWQQRLFLLESDLRLADGRKESALRIMQLSQRNGIEARQRWQQIQEQAQFAAEKYAASEKAVLQAISRCQDRLQPVDPDQMKRELGVLDHGIAADESAVAEIFQRSGCADWEAFERLLQEADQYRGAVRTLQQTREEAETRLELAGAQASKAANVLTELISMTGPLINPADALLRISQLQESLRQAEMARNKVLQEEARFQDILGDRTITEWQATISRIHFELAQMKEQPSLLSEQQLQLLRSEIRDNQTEQLGLCEKIAALDSVIRMSARHQEPVSELDEQIAVNEHRLASMKLYHQRLSIARAALDQAASDLQNSFGPQLNIKAGAILAELTAGKYDELKVDRSFMIRISDPADRNFHEWQYLSGGTIDQVYLALRLAISELICEQQEQLPLLFDDILIQYDDIRTAASLKYFDKKCRQSGQQILLFSCQKRYSAAVESAGWPVIGLA